MNIKSSQTLVQEALSEVNTISPSEALEKLNKDECNLIDIRDANELQKLGRIVNLGVRPLLVTVQRPKKQNISKQWMKENNRTSAVRAHAR